jgi:hypothetical protein
MRTSTNKILEGSSSSMYPAMRWSCWGEGMEVSWKFEIQLHNTRSLLRCLDFCGTGEETLSLNMYQRNVQDLCKASSPLRDTVELV